MRGARSGILGMCLFASLSATVAVADALVVVPGRNSGYLWAPEGAQDDAPGGRKFVSLAVFKLDGYSGYRLVSEPPGLLCDENCTENAGKVPSGNVVLRIGEMEPVPGLKIVQTGIWQAPCDNTTTETSVCAFNLNALNAQVRVTVKAGGLVGRDVTLPEGGTAVLVDLNTAQGLVTLARKEPGPALTWLEYNSRLNPRDMTLGEALLDGPGNTRTLAQAGARDPQSKAAQYCAELAPKGQWYLPSRSELGLMSAATFAKVGVSANDTVWSSSGSWSYLQQGTSPNLTATYRASAWHSDGKGTVSSGVAFHTLCYSSGACTHSVPAVSRKALCFRQLKF